MKRLLSLCGKLFQDGDHRAEIRSLLNGKGYVIESIADIAPGSTIYASDVDPDFEPHLSEAQTATASVVASTPVPRAASKTKKHPETPITERSRVPIFASKQTSLELPTLTTDSLELDPLGTSKSPLLFRAAQVKPQTSNVSVNMRQLARKQMSSDSDGEKPQSHSKASKLSKFLQKAHISSDDEDDEETRRRRAERKQQHEMMQSSVSLQNEENIPVQQLIEELIPPQDAPRLLEDALATISRDRVQFIQSGCEYEGQHLALWLKAAANQPFLKRGPQQPYHDRAFRAASLQCWEIGFISFPRRSYRASPFGEIGSARECV
jgi:hypothetical protein